MGTTLTAVLFSGSKIGMVHIGDSRAYLLRDGEFAQITKDDTYVQMLVDEGRISAEEASSHPQRSLLTRALDGRDIDPEYSVRQVLTGDRYLICSDGLSGVVSAETIGDSLREYADPQACVERLVQLALRGGGPDNITVIIADATDADIVEQAPIVGGAAARDRGNGHRGRRAPPRRPAPSALQRAAPGRARPDPRPTGTPSPSAPGHPVRTAAAPAGAAGRARRRPLRRLAATPSSSTTSARPTRASSRSSAACPARSPASTCPASTRPARPSSTTSPRSRRSRSSRASRRESRADAVRRLAELDQRRPGQPQPEAGLPPVPPASSPAPRSPAERRPSARAPAAAGPARDRRAGRHRHAHAAHHTRRSASDAVPPAGPGGLPAARVTAGRESEGHLRDRARRTGSSARHHGRAVAYASAADPAQRRAGAAACSRWCWWRCTARPSRRTSSARSRRDFWVPAALLACCSSACTWWSGSRRRTPIRS